MSRLVFIFKLLSVFGLSAGVRAEFASAAGPVVSVMLDEQFTAMLARREIVRKDVPGIRIARGVNVS